MGETLSIDLGAIYTAWANYLKGHSDAKHFSMLGDGNIAKFPHANLRLLGNPTNSSDLDNDECTWNVTFQTTCYISTPNDTKVLSLYGMDNACRDFFVGLGFRKMGESIPMVNTQVASITSRYNMTHYNGSLDL